MVENSARIKFYRLYKRIRGSVELLHEKGKLTDCELASLIEKTEELYSEWRAEMREARKPFLKPPGRPRTDIPRNQAHPTCKRDGCSLPSAPQQVYCSKECAPLSEYGRDWFKNPRTK